MSRRRKVIESSSSESEEDSSKDSSAEEYAPSQPVKRKKQTSSKSSSQSQSSSSQVSMSATHQYVEEAESEEEALARSAGLVANYFLTAECKKIPVKRSDLGKVIPKKHMQKDNLQPIINESSALLEKIYGYKILELKNKKHHYILLNILSPAINEVSQNALATNSESATEDTEEEEDGEVQNPKDHNMLPPDEKQGLLYLILTTIYMMDGIVEEVTLHSFLKCLGVYTDSKDLHPVFGNTKKLMEDFIKQNYIDLTVQKDVDPPSKLYTWGERAHLQVCKKSILDFVCKVYGGGMQPQNWIDHYNKLIGVQEVSSSNGSSVEEIMET